jgi:hypothetical protein
MRRLSTGIRSKKCVVRRFRRCANVIQCTFTNLYSLLHTYSMYSLLLLSYKPVQHVTVLNTVGNCNRMVCIILYHNRMGPPSYMRFVVDRNVVMRRIPVYTFIYKFKYTEYKLKNYMVLFWKRVLQSRVLSIISHGLLYITSKLCSESTMV